MKQSALTQKAVLTFDLLRLAGLSGSLKNAYCYLKQNHPLNVISGSFQGLRFSARRSDWPAVREVFLNHEYDCLEHLFNPQDKPNILDLGAHIGLFALKAFSHTQGARIYSVEAAPDTGEMLQKNMHLNPNLDWHFIKGAIWKNNDSIYLKRVASSLGHKVSEDDTGERIDAFTPDDILIKTGWQKIDLIKIDIEGAELDVIPVSGNLLSKAESVIIEVHEDRIDGSVVVSELKRKFKNIYQLGNRNSEKPVFLFSNKTVHGLGRM